LFATHLPLLGAQDFRTIPKALLQAVMMDEFSEYQNILQNKKGWACSKAASMLEKYT
jgi:hypothetical protein